MYEYRAVCDRVVDGDTIDCTVDLGFGICKTDRFRLLGINTPEVRGEEREAGKEASRFLRSFIEGRNIIIRTHKDRQGKYGRYLAVVFYTQAGTSFNVNAHLVENGHAEPIHGFDRVVHQRIDA